MAQLESCNTKIQDVMRQQEADSQMLQLQDRIPGFMLVDCNREFMREGPANIMYPKHDRRRRCHVFLVGFVNGYKTFSWLKQKWKQYVCSWDADALLAYSLNHSSYYRITICSLTPPSFLLLFCNYSRNDMQTLVWW